MRGPVAAFAQTASGTSRLEREEPKVMRQLMTAMCLVGVLTIVGAGSGASAQTAYNPPGTGAYNPPGTGYTSYNPPGYGPYNPVGTGVPSTTAYYNPPGYGAYN